MSVCVLLYLHLKLSFSPLERGHQKVTTFHPDFTSFEWLFESTDLVLGLKLDFGRGHSKGWVRHVVVNG